MRIYFDNAATTPLDPQVFEVMAPMLRDHFGNPSSTHEHGRKVKVQIELARKKVAQLLKCTTGEIVFTSGGTEADNMAIRNSVENLGITHCITTKIEHHAVLHTLEELEKKGKIKLSFVRMNGQGEVDLNDLELLLKNNSRSFVSLMHANNEVGTMIDLVAIGNLVRQYDGIFHSDTVQTMGHFEHNLSVLPVDFVTAAAHKFNGPKGTGFLYINKRLKLHPFITGGGQERSMRGGTENVYGMVGLAKALELAYSIMPEKRRKIEEVKQHFIQRLSQEIPGISFNGTSGDLGKSLYTVLNVNFPKVDRPDMLLFQLDLNGVSCSGGSACSSGATKGSHVLAEMDRDMDAPAVRFSFGKHNTVEEVDFTIEVLKKIFK
jgi:cysteine desulfurase